MGCTNQEEWEKMTGAVEMSNTCLWTWIDVCDRSIILMALISHNLWKLNGIHTCRFDSSLESSPRLRQTVHHDREQQRSFGLN